MEVKIEPITGLPVVQLPKKYAKFGTCDDILFLQPVSKYNSTGGKSPRVLIIRPARVLLADPKQYVISRSINPLKIREIFIQNDYDGSHMALVVEDEFSVKMQLDGGHAENFVRILTSAMTAQHRPAPQLTRVPRPGRSIHDDNIHINVPKDMLKKPTSFQSPTLLLSVKQKREKLGVSVKSLNGQKRHLSPLHQDAADSFEDRADVGSDGSTPTATSMSPPEPCTPYKPLLDQQRLQAEIERQLREVSAKAEEARGEAGGLDGRSPLADRRPIPPHLKHPSIVDYNAASYYIDPMRPHKGPIVDFSQCEAAMEGVYTPPEARSPLGLPSHPRTRSNQFLSNIGASQAGAVSHFSEFTPPASPTELPRQHLQGDRQEDWLLASMTNALEVEIADLERRNNDVYSALVKEKEHRHTNEAQLYDKVSGLVKRLEQQQRIIGMYEQRELLKEKIAAHSRQGSLGVASDEPRSSNPPVQTLASGATSRGSHGKLRSPLAPPSPAGAVAKGHAASPKPGGTSPPHLFDPVAKARQLTVFQTPSSFGAQPAAPLRSASAISAHPGLTDTTGYLTSTPTTASDQQAARRRMVSNPPASSKPSKRLLDLI